LEAATAGAYQLVECREGGNVVGRMPYLLRRDKGLMRGIMPDLTHFLGPAVAEGPGNEGTRFLRRIEITKELIAQLPKAAFFEIKCHRGIADVVAFQEMHFRTAVQFTHEILPQPERIVWKSFRDKCRGAIRRGLHALKLERIDDPEEFMRFYEANLDERELSNNMNRANCLRVLRAACEKGQGAMRGARDRSGALVAATFCAWDAVAAYFLLGSRKRGSDGGAISTLVWLEIKDAMERGLIFDFDGICHAGMVHFFAGFSGAVAPRFIVRRMNLPFQVVWDIHHAFSNERWFF
jgi:hypothetical protein